MRASTSKWISFLVAFCMPWTVWAADITREYGIASTIEFTMYNASGAPLEGEVDGGTEVTLTCNDGTPTTATNDFEETQDGGYQLALTAAELRCARLRIDVNASVKNTYLLETYGSHLAAHPGNVVRGETAQAGAATTITLDTGASGTTDAYKWHIIEIRGGTGAGQTRLITTYNGTTKVANVNRSWLVNPASDSQFAVKFSEQAFVVVDANGRISSNVEAYDGDATAGANAEAFFDNTGFNASNSTIGTVTNYTGNTPQTGDSYTRIGANGSGLTQVGLVDGNITAAKIASAAFTEPKFGDGAISARVVATGALDSDALATSFIQEIMDHAIDGAIDLEEAICYMHAVLANVSNFNDVDTIVFRNAANTADMVTVTVNTANSDRTSIVRAACGS